MQVVPLLRVVKQQNSTPPLPNTSPAITQPVTPEPVQVQHDDTFQQLLLQKVQVPPTTVQGSPFPKINLGGLSSSQLHPEWLTYHIFDDQGCKQSLDDLLSGSSSQMWKQPITNDLACLSQGIEGKDKATNTVRFIKKIEVPRGKMVMYGNMVCHYIPVKEKQLDFT